MTMTYKQIPQYRVSAGFSLIEVLVTLVVLSLGLIGLASLQITSLRFNQSALSRTQASILAADILDCIRANPGNAANYAITASATPSTGTIAGTDLTNWRTRIANSLGTSATSTVTGPDAENKYTVEIQWSDAGDAIGASRATQTFRYIAQP